MHPPVLELYRQRRASLLLCLSAAFPTAPPEVVEEVLQDTFTWALERPQGPRAGWPPAPERLYGLILCVAWRKLRGRVCRGAGRFERWGSDGLEGWSAPDQEALACLGERVNGLIDEAALRYGGTDPQRLRAALRHRVVHDEADTAVAAAFGVRRENLNRAKRHLIHGLAA